MTCDDPYRIFSDTPAKGEGREAGLNGAGVHEDFLPLSECLARISAFVRDAARETGEAVTVEQMTVALPLELSIRLNEDNVPMIFTASPNRTMTSVPPYLHPFKMTVGQDG